MIDLHCHLLPGVDDGARTLEDSLDLVRAAVDSGIRGAVLTPHYYPGVWDNEIARLLPTFAALKGAVAAAGIDFPMQLAAEIRLHPDSIDKLIHDELPFLGTYEGDDVALIELPDGNIPPGTLQACQRLVGKGIRPMIAHPERNKDVVRDPNRVRALVDAGCLMQITAASVINQFGEPALATAHKLLSMGLVHVVATDAHNLAHRPPRLFEARDAIRHFYGQGVAYRLTEETPASIAAGNTSDVA